MTQAMFGFRLYLAGDAQNSLLAVANLRSLCRTYLSECHQIEVVDVLQDPKRAFADGIFMTPTLIKFAPTPMRRIVGTLSQTTTVLQALGLEEISK